MNQGKNKIREETENYRACLLWNDSEDLMLDREFRVAVLQIAENHKRSYGSIYSRLEKKILELRKRTK